MKLGDRVTRLRTRAVGTIIRDLGVMNPLQSQAPLADISKPEQAWRVRFELAGYTDEMNCWESDLEIVHLLAPVLTEGAVVCSFCRFPPEECLCKPKT